MAWRLGYRAVEGLGAELIEDLAIFRSCLALDLVGGTPGHRAMILRSEISWTREP